MDNETDVARVDPRQLPVTSFTESDLARIELVCSAGLIANRLRRYVQMLGEDQAQAGDYVRLAQIYQANDDLMEKALVAERVRGTSWDVLAEALGVAPEEVEKEWSGVEGRWRRESPATSVLRKDPGFFAATADTYITTGAPGRSGVGDGRPLSASLDAAAHVTGRDVAAADQAFAGAPVCAHCSR
ncbi:hypothetical protein ACGFR6_27485 [Streptomyces sp. NPDC048567]|uniref:hypothetical protein n=1 Tax=Streptomyces sp. NPDC048567 TaxID=3365570 RepID=UPI0037177B9A